MRSLTMLAVWVSLAAAAPGADRDTIVYVREAKDARGQPNTVLERIRADGSGRSVIFDADVRKSPEPIPFPKWQRSPDVSPVGAKIVLRRSWTISSMDRDGSNAVNLTPYGREWYDPRWSPDGRRIALCADARDFAEIYVMDHDGGNLRNITWKARSNERSPDWSPDGRTICFISDRNGKFELFAMNAADGMAQTRILSLDGDIREPSWGPNNRIAFALQRADGTSALFAVDPDGRNLAQLTDGRFWDGQAAWDGDGRRVAFVSNRDGSSDIWVLDVASKGLRNVTRTPGDDELFPAWVPKQIADRPLEIAAKDGTAANTAGLTLPRPRLLFRAEDLPAIRETFAKEPHAGAWKAFLARCDALTDPASHWAKRVETAIAEIRGNPPQGLYDRSGWITPVFDLAFARQVTGERRYGDRAAAWLARVAAEYARWHQRMVAEYPVACAYDWLRDLFAPDDLLLVTRILQTTAAQSYRRVNESYFGETNLIASNFATHDAGSVGPIFLALSGEPGSDAAWLSAAARLTAINLNTWIGPAGDAAEGTSYFNYPVNLLMPFLISLKINGLHPETRETNLRKFADWYAVVNAGGILPSIGDSDGGSVHFPVGLLRLYPENATARKLWNGAPRPERPSPDVLSLLWFEPSENGPQDYAGFPKAACFDAQNYQVFRSGYGRDSAVLTFALTAGGHAHDECGAVSLTAFGRKLLVDPGQAVKAADCHSQLLIDGRGRFVNYETGGAPRQRMGEIRTERLAAASSVDMAPAFASRDVSTHSGPAYGIPGPGIRMERGGRIVAMVGGDGGPVPPYFLLHDDVRVDGRAHAYEQIYIGEGDMEAVGGADGPFVYRRRYAGPWLAPVPGAKGEALLEFDVPKAGNYHVWILTDGTPGTVFRGNFSFRTEAAQYAATVAFRGSRGDCWQWAAVVFGEGGRPDPDAADRAARGEPAIGAVALPAGTQTLRIVPRDTSFAAVALVPEAESASFRGWAALPRGAIARSCGDAVVTGEGWLKRTADRAFPELLVAPLNDEPAAFAAESFSFNTRFYGQQFVTLPRAKLAKRQVESNFLTLLYPYLPGTETPAVRRERNGAVVSWRNAVDTIRAAAGEISVVRRHRDGREETFRYRRQ